MIILVVPELKSCSIRKYSWREIIYVEADGGSFWHSFVDRGRGVLLLERADMRPIMAAFGKKD
jgi:hypothetical protein